MKDNELEMTRAGLEPATYGLKVERGGQAAQQVSASSLSDASGFAGSNPSTDGDSVTNLITSPQLVDTAASHLRNALQILIGLGRNDETRAPGVVQMVEVDHLVALRDRITAALELIELQVSAKTHDVGGFRSTLAAMEQTNAELAAGPNAVIEELVAPAGSGA